MHPETPEDGIILEELFPGRDLTPIKKRMQELMGEAGLPYGDRSRTYNSRLAQELSAWAVHHPGGEAIHNLLYKAYFVEGINIGKIDELMKIAQTAGLDPDSAKNILETRKFKSNVDRDWQHSRRMGITGVPTTCSEDLTLVGCRPYEEYEQFVNDLIKLKKS